MRSRTLNPRRQGTAEPAIAGRRRRIGVRGFSLVPVIIALQIATVVALVGAPQVGNYVARFRLNGTANQLAFDIARARMQAVGRNRIVRIRMINSTQYTRSVSTDGTTWTTLETTTLPRGVTTTTAGAEVRFDRRGFATVTTPISLLGATRTTKTVTTSPIGRVTLG